ncbi:hypothetical protein Desde_1054 [Desulfitobacterium dehalogenans ATCC 51507]|uniref:Uncharacterized protein n=2 Tax=Desulfitobacterium dehalogenans TaxID=36854 RepID=I4A6A2_DESDJ|nr:hypothetical protein Desde_1054 [Desulfitobacterium dehalogenans ATCC 51507]
MISMSGQSQIITEDMVELPSEVEGVEEYFLVEVFAKGENGEKKVGEEEFSAYPNNNQLLWAMAKYAQPEKKWDVCCHVQKYYRYRSIF